MDHTADQAAFAGWEPGVERSGEQVRAKAHELLAQLTLDEKIDMMDGDIPFWSGMIEMMQGGYADHPWPAGAIPRLGRCVWLSDAGDRVERPIYSPELQKGISSVLCKQSWDKRETERRRTADREAREAVARARKS